MPTASDAVASRVARRRRPRPRPAVVALALVAAAFVLLGLWINGLRFPLDLDEAVYASQFSRRVPHIPYAAHRSAGQGLLAAPLTLLTSSPVALRAYFTVLSGVLLFLAYLPWIRPATEPPTGPPAGPAGRLAGGVVPVAATLLAVAWVPVRFGAAVLPNFPVAACAVAAAALVVSGRAWPGLLVTMAAIGLLRPTDAVWIAVPLLAAAIGVRAWRRPATPAAILAGLAVGAIAWVAEAYARFGDPITRLRAVSRLTAEGGGFQGRRYLQALHGTETCLPAAPTCGPAGIATLAWCAGALALVAVGLAAAPRAVRPALWLCAATAAACALPYLLLSGWAVPRYLLAAAALATLPAAYGLAAALAVAHRRAGPAAAPLLAGGLAAALFAYAFWQIGTAQRAAERTRRALTWPAAAAQTLHRYHIDGGTHPCAVLGKYAPQIAYLRGCRAADMHDGLGPRNTTGDITAGNLRRLAGLGLRVIVIAKRRPDLPASRHWTILDDPGHARTRIYLPPAPVTS